LDNLAKKNDSTYVTGDFSKRSALRFFIERHSATGPSGGYGRSCKALASLLAVAKHIPSQAEWVRGVSQQNDVKKMLADDFDRAGDIVQSWLANAVQQFKEYGIALKPVQDC
jgi:hypothetical protein